jgi:hypothetical protein
MGGERSATRSVSWRGRLADEYQLAKCDISVHIVNDYIYSYIR